MNDRNDDLTINGRPAPGDEVIGPSTTSPTKSPTTPPATPPIESASATAAQPAATPPTGVNAPGAPGVPTTGIPATGIPGANADTIETAPRLPRARPIDQSLPPAQGEAGKSPEQIRQDIAQTRDEMSGTLDAIEDRMAPQNLTDQLRDRAMDRAREMTSQMGTTAGQLLGQAMELGSAAEQGARTLGELVQRQASEIVRQAQERFGMLEPHPGEGEGTGTSDHATTPTSVIASGTSRVTQNARQLGRRVGEQLPTEVNPIAVAALGLTLGLAIGGAIFLLTRRRETVRGQTGATTDAPNAAPQPRTTPPEGWNGPYDTWEVIEIR